MSSERPTADWLSRAHALLGVGPLGAYLVYHLWQQWPLLGGREGWVDRARATSALGWEIALVLLPLALHALLGALRMRRPGPVVPGPNGSKAMRYFQAGTGVVVLLFLLYHLTQTYTWDRGPHYSPRAGYAVLWQTLGRPVDVIVYAIGLAAVCFHLAHGLPRAMATLGFLRAERGFRIARYVASALGLLLWLGYVQLLSQLAIGEGLLPASANRDHGAAYD